VRRLLRCTEQPTKPGISEHRIEHHQPLADAPGGHWSAMRAIRFTDGPVQSDVMDVIEPPTIVSARVRRRVPPADELPKKGTRLLAMNDAGEGRVLAQQADAGVAHHQHQESGLTLREPELGDGLNPVFGSHKILLGADRIDAQSGQRSSSLFTEL